MDIYLYWIFILCLGLVHDKYVYSKFGPSLSCPVVPALVDGMPNNMIMMAQSEFANDGFLTGIETYALTDGTISISVRSNQCGWIDGMLFGLIKINCFSL